MLLESDEHLGGYANSNEADNVYDNPPVANEANNNFHNNNNNNNEMRNNVGDNRITIERGTPIQNFYADQSVFITGGTGFLGKILIEKLLRSCPGISTIYLLIRARKDKNVDDRLENLFNDPVYDRLRAESPKFRHKVIAMSGDCSNRGLGLSSPDQERLVREVSIVFHSAATVRFDEKLDMAMAINVGSTLDMIDLCKRMKKLRAFIHVSTAYANCTVPKIEETFYRHPKNYEDLNALISSLDNEEIVKMTPQILDQWPNTYTFTKALAEVVVKEKSEGLIMGIFRPAIVTSTAYEPVPGWIDNFYGPTGAVAAVASGILKTMYCHPTTEANIVPVDFTVNALIASAWDVSNQQESRRNENMLIYNYISTVDAPLTWQKFTDINLVYANEFPLSQIKWTMSLALHKYKAMDFLSRIFLHYIPAILVDSFCICLGQKPMLMKMYRKIHKFIDVITWFCIRDWIFTNDNVQNMWNRLDTKDKQNFRFSIKELSWRKYFKNYIKGLRIHLLKDDVSTLEASRKKLKRFRMIHETLKALLFTLVLWFMWKILAPFFF